MPQRSNDHLIRLDSQTGNPTIVLKKDYFEQTAVLKILRLFSDKVLCEMLPEGNRSIKIEFLSPQKKNVDMDKIPYEFYNAVIDQQIREDLIKSSADIQKSIYNTAFSTIS